MHELGFLLLESLHGVAAVAVAFRKLGLAGVVAGEGAFNLLNKAETEWIDHGEVVDGDGNEGFPDCPGASLLSSVDGIL